MATSRLYRITAAVFLAMLIGGASAALHAFEGNATNTQPLAFGPDQRIIDLHKVHWTSLKLRV
jgi:hypothetical protein